MTCFEAWKYPDFEEFAFESNRSLLEYDIVLWNIEYLHFGYNLSFEHNASDLQRLLLDRKRRLHEIEVLLNNGKSLAILLSKSESLTIDIISIEEDFDLFHYPEIIENIKTEFVQHDVIDTYSFLPTSIEYLIRKYSVSARGSKMACSENKQFSRAGMKLASVAWYNSYFLQPIGFPLFFLEGTHYPVGCWLRYSNGNVFLLPGTEYDDGADYPTFVEAVKELVEITEIIGTNEIEVPRLSPGGKPLEIWDENMNYINPSRLAELKKLESDNFDLAKLISLCEELNKNFNMKCCFAIAMLTRAILDHVPPIFGFTNFLQVSNNYTGSGKSFREAMQHLENSSRKIADLCLHSQIRKKETLPNITQVDFRNNLDVLLGEVVRILR